MTLIVNVLGGGSFETEGVQEDALMLAGAVASGLGDEFAPYMDALKPYILRGLANTDAPEVHDALANHPCPIILIQSNAPHAHTLERPKAHILLIFPDVHGSPLLQVCKISVELIGDFATAMKMAIAPSCDEFMSGLLAALQVC